jgi:tetraacyldisaccharide 4'-kinase
VLDDAFQHRRLARDLDIVLVDATDPPAARWLLPGGLYREPMSSLRRADFVILTRADQVSNQALERLERMVERRAPHAGIGRARHQPRSILHSHTDELELGTLQQLPVLAFCAIGNPASFFNLLTSLGAVLVDRRIWPDHHAFDPSDVRWLADWTGSYPEARMLICTMKDWVKLQVPQIGNLKLGALKIELDFLTGREKLEQRLTAISHRIPSLHAQPNQPE